MSNSIALTHNAIVLTRNAIVLTRNAIALTRNAIALTHNSIALTHNAIALTHNAIVLTYSSNAPEIMDGAVLSRTYALYRLPRSQSPTGNAFIESLAQCLTRGGASNQAFLCSS